MQHDDKGKMIIFGEGTWANSKMVDYTYESFAFYYYFRLFILCNKLSTAKRKVIKEVDKTNPTNFDDAMLCSVGYAQCKTRESAYK